MRSSERFVGTMKRLFFVGNIFFFTACSTGYYSSNLLRNGYSEKRVAEDHFVVQFEGNEWTKKKDAKIYAMRRAAQLALESGFHYFAVIGYEDRSQKVQSKPDPNEDFVEMIATWLTEGGEAPSIVLSIQCYKERPLDRAAIDAHYFLSTN